MNLAIETMRIRLPAELGHRANAIGHATVRSLYRSSIASQRRSCDRLAVAVPHQVGATDEAIGAAIADAVLNQLRRED